MTSRLAVTSPLTVIDATVVRRRACSSEAVNAWLVIERDYAAYGRGYAAWTDVRPRRAGLPTLHPKAAAVVLGPSRAAVLRRIGCGSLTARGPLAAGIRRKEPRARRRRHTTPERRVARNGDRSGRLRRLYKRPVRRAP